MLTQIAYEVFQTSPIVGGGAGTFLDRVGSTRVFLLEYGDPLDSHGIIQKLAAETGILGLAAFAVFVSLAGWLLWRGVREIETKPMRRAALFVSLGAFGAFAYQLFNTDYWTGVMWLPLGFAISAVWVLGRKEAAVRTHGTFLMPKFSVRPTGSFRRAILRP